MQDTIENFFTVDNLNIIMPTLLVICAFGIEDFPKVSSWSYRFCLHIYWASYGHNYSCLRIHKFIHMFRHRSFGDWIWYIFCRDCISNIHFRFLQGIYRNISKHKPNKKGKSTNGYILSFIVCTSSSILLHICIYLWRKIEWIRKVIFLK